MFRFRDSHDDFHAELNETNKLSEIDVLNQADRFTVRPVSNDWVDMGVCDVPVREIPSPEGIHNSQDFLKVSESEMRTGLARLQEMKPIIDSGEGMDSDYWGRVDAEKGFDYEHGYRRVYDAFYGHDAIRLVKDGDKYDIINGRHRIWLAKRMDIETLPARVIKRNTAL